MTQFSMTPGTQGPDPKRLLLAVIATSGVLMLYSYFFAPTAPVVSEQSKNIVESDKPILPKKDLVSVKKITQAHAQATPENTPLVEKILSMTKPELEHVNERVSYRVKFSNMGGAFTQYSLIDFSKPKDFFDSQTQSSVFLTLSSPSSNITLSGNEKYIIKKLEQDNINFEYVTPEGIRVERKYKLGKKSNITERIIISNLTNTPIKANFNLVAQKVEEKLAEPSFFNPGVQAESIIIKSSKKREKITIKNLLKEEKEFSDTLYAGFDDQFFLGAILFKNNNLIKNIKLSSRELEDSKTQTNIKILWETQIISPDEPLEFAHEIFIGPKQIDLLSSFKPPLDDNIDFGWFGVLSRPMMWLLVQIFNFVNNYGIAIMLITFIIKLLTYPLTHKSFKSQQEMKKLQPKVKKLQEKYSNDRTLLGQKQMELYKEHGVNPVAGCLPMLIQVPIWLAFFQMLRNSVELYDQPFYGWITDLTLPDPFFVLPIFMGISMAVQQAFTPTPTDQPQMKYVMWGMPVFLTLIMLNMPAGLSLYLLTNNLLTILQQLIIKKQTA